MRRHSTPFLVLAATLAIAVGIAIGVSGREGVSAIPSRVDTARREDLRRARR